MKILIVVTGGTFGSKNIQNSLDVASQKEIISVIEELLQPQEIDYKIISPIITLSENMNPKHWHIIISAIIKEYVNDMYSAILVIHGTDTMAYTANAISYIEMLSKHYPIVFTGANYPIFNKNSDGEINLSDSIKVLKEFITNKIKGSFIIFNGLDNKHPTYIHLATRVKKEKWEGNCYTSLYLKAHSMGESDNFDIDTYENIFPKTIKYNLKPVFNDSLVMALKLYVGLNSDILIDLFKSGKKYFILEIYNSGTAPADESKYSLIKSIEYITKNGGIVFAISQHEGGEGAKMDIYQSSINLQKAGLISLGNMIWESAVTKLMCCVGNFTQNDDIIKYMQTNIAGEIF